MENKVGQVGEDRLRKEQIIDHIPGGIAIYRIGKTVETLYFNEGVCDLHGKTREEYALGIRKNPIADVFEEDRQRVLSEAYSFISRGLPIDISYRIYHKTMPPRWVHLTAHQVQKEENAAIYAAILMDISKEHHMLDALLLRAEHDDLTGLYNRAGFKHILYQFFAKKNQTDACFVMLDIDNFKTINDAYGHTKGDEILCMLAAALEQYGDSDTVVGRLGGDEFAIFMPNIGHGEDAMLRLQRLCDATKLEIHVEEVHLSVSCSLGVCMAPEHGSDFDTLYDHADRALFATKRTDKGKFAMYDESMMNPSPILLQNMEWLLDEGSDAIYICNADTYELLYLNRVARSLFAIEEEDPIGKPCYEALMHFDQPCPFCKVSQMCRDSFCEREFVSPTNHLLLLRGKLIGWNGITAHIEFVQDNTKRDRLTRQVRLSEERFRMAISMTDISVWEYDFATKSIHQSVHSKRCVGGADDIYNVPQSLIDSKHYHPDSEGEARAVFDRLAAGERIVDAELLVHDEIQDSYWWEGVRYSTVYDTNGQPLKAIAIGKDITEEKNLELRYNEALRNNDSVMANTLVSFQINLTKDLVETCIVQDPRMDNLRQFTSVTDLFASILPSVSVDREKVAGILNRDVILEEFAKGKGEFELEYCRDLGEGVDCWLHVSIRLFKHHKLGDAIGFIYTYDSHLQKMTASVMNAVVER